MVGEDLWVTDHGSGEDDGRGGFSLRLTQIYADYWGMGPIGPSGLGDGSGEVVLVRAFWGELVAVSSK